MAGLDAQKVMVGLPDQETTGAIHCAEIGTALPTSVTATLTGFDSSGYVDTSGLQLTQTYSTADINEWSGGTVRTVLQSYKGELAWTEISILDYEAACHAFGEENVSKVEATTTHGEQITINIGPHLPEAKSWAFRMKDGDRRMLVVVPNGQVTSVGTITFVAGEAIRLPITLSCNVDSTGESIYIYTDDGVVSA